MSRSSAVTSAGSAHAIPRSATPAVPRRVSGPAGPPERGGGLAGPPPQQHPNAGQPARASRAQIDATALAQAAAAVAPQRRALPAPARRRRAVAVPAPRRLAYGGAAIATRMADVALDVSSSRAMDRLVRSRIWIGVIAFALLGIVATQVSLLKLNTGISKAVLTASTLERSNAGLRREVSRLSAPERIRPMAEAQGFVMPAPADVGYLRASNTSATAKRAATSIQAPDTAVAGPAGSVITTGLEDVAAQEATGAPAPGTSAATPADPAPATSAPPPQEAPAPAVPAPAVPAPAVPAPPPPAAQISGASGGAPAQQATTPPLG
jgi:hypothetical protein